MYHLLLLIMCSKSEGNLEIRTFSAFLAEAAQSKGKLRKITEKPIEMMEMAEAIQSKGKS